MTADLYEVAAEFDAFMQFNPPDLVPGVWLYAEGIGAFYHQDTLDNMTTDELRADFATVCDTYGSQCLNADYDALQLGGGNIIDL